KVHSPMDLSLDLADLRIGEEPVDVALVLGSGLGAAARRINRTRSIPYAEIPGLVAPSVPGHQGVLSIGHCGQCRVLLFEGRAHYYEGCPWRTVTATVSVASWFGAGTLILTNAAGGIRSDLHPG